MSSSSVFPRAPDPRVPAPIEPGRLPLFGHQWTLIFRVLDMYARQRAAGNKAFWVDLGPAGWQLLLLEASSYELLRDRSVSVRHYSELVPDLLGHSLLTKDGPEHRRARNAMNRPFTPQGLTSAGVGALIREVVGAWAARVAASDEVVLLSAARDVALDVIFRVLGIEDEALPDWRRNYEDVLLSVVPLRLKLPGLPAWRAARGRAWVRGRLAERVAQARAGQHRPGLLVEVVRDWDAAPEPAPDGELYDNLLVLALAGHETTASTITWMGALLASHPEVWDRLVQEATAGELPGSPAEMAAFPWAEACFREALRLYPPVPALSRIVEADVTVGDLHLPAGLQVGFPVLAWFRDPAVFPEPEAFRPERWLGKRPTALEMLAFSFGPHFCLGYHVAVAEGVVAAVGLARELAARGRRPALAGRFPRFRSAGLLQAVKGETRVRFV